MLIHDMMEQFYIMDKTKAPDGEGGFTTTWTQSSTTFDAVITTNTSMETRIAERDSLVSKYTITTERSTLLQKNDVIKRVLDNNIYRITSDATDVVSPAFSNINMAQVTAEKWELTT